MRQQPRLREAIRLLRPFALLVRQLQRQDEFIAMRRQDIRLLAAVRQGDIEARYEVARRYLLGVDGFPRHPVEGLDYLAHPTVAGSDRGAVMVGECLALQDLVQLEQLPTLHVAAKGSSAAAKYKLGVWLCLTARDSAEGLQWIERAAELGHAVAAETAKAVRQGSCSPALAALRSSTCDPTFDMGVVLKLALEQALQFRDAERVGRCLQCTLELVPGLRVDLADTVCSALEFAQAQDRFPLAAPNDRIEAYLEHCIQRGNAAAALLLGRALCGLDAGALKATALTKGQNLRRGAALLLRAADAGRIEAWSLLYRVHADNHASVANPQMARFFLEKAALSGCSEAQRRLGALILRGACTLHESEQGIGWLHRAAGSGDAAARRLLGSLVLTVAGPEDEAASAIAAIRRSDPWMAYRLRTARDFGLTRLEALSVDIASGARPWGLVVGPNPFITQVKLSAPRAIPALTLQAAENLRGSAAWFEHARRDGSPPEGDLRKRSMRLRQLLERHGVSESLFVAEARSTTLDTLRQGTKWAFHVRQPLRMALAG
jgi:TPR repeat protein